MSKQPLDEKDLDKVTGGVFVPREDGPSTDPVTRRRPGDTVRLPSDDNRIQPVDDEEA